MPEVIWKDPPSLRQRVSWPENLLLLVDRPRTWALVKTFKSPAAAHATKKYLRGNKTIRSLGPIRVHGTG